MKCEIVIDPACEEKVVIYAKAESPFTEEIRRAVEQHGTAIFGYIHNEIVKLDPRDVCCISVIGNKVYALCREKRYLLKERLYVLEEKLPSGFVKINQSCLGNVAMMERFDTSISGTLKIRFKNGHVDYVSRRQLKVIKERLGL